MPEMAGTSREEVDMKQLQALSGDTGFVVRTRRPVAPSYACATPTAWAGPGSDVTGAASFAAAPPLSTAGHLSHLGANGRMTVTTTVRRRPPETPT